MMTTLARASRRVQTATCTDPRRNLVVDTVAGGEAADGKPADQAGTKTSFPARHRRRSRSPGAHSCRGQGRVPLAWRETWACPGGQSTAADSASRGRRLTGKPVTESNLILRAPAQRAAAMARVFAGRPSHLWHTEWMICTTAQGWRTEDLFAVKRWLASANMNCARRPVDAASLSPAVSGMARSGTAPDGCSLRSASR